MDVRDRSPITWPLALATLIALLPPGPAAPAEDPFAECEKSFAHAPDDRESAYCFFEAALRGAAWEQAIKRLDAHRVRHPDNPWLHLHLGHSLLFQLSPLAEERYRRAVELLAGRGDAEGEVYARIDLSRFLTRFGRLDEAGEELDRASELAASRGDLILLAAIHIREAFQLRSAGRDLEYAAHLVELAEKDLFPDGPRNLRKQLLDAKAIVSHALGRYDQYLGCKQQLLAMAEEDGNLTAIAQARYDIAVHSISAEMPSDRARRAARALFEVALAAAQEAAHPLLEVQSRHLLGGLAAGEEGREHLEACLRLTADLGEVGKRWSNRCRVSLAASLAEDDPTAAAALIGQALAAARDSDDLWATAFGSTDRMYLRWATLPRAEAIADSMEVLDALEALRELQASGSGRAGLMTLLSEFYQRFAGRLLDGAAGRADLERAFEVMERLRARVLLEALTSAQAASPPPAADPLVARLKEVLASKVRLNRLLLAADLAPEDRQRAIAELDAVESDEGWLRHQIAEAAPAYGGLQAPALATLGQVEQSLGEKEALLSFQFGLDRDFQGRFAGGAWLLASSRGGTRAYRIPDRVALEPALDVLLDVPDLDAAATALARLDRDLLAPALAELPEDVERLVIVADGSLHRLPFALLRPDSEPLIARYQLSYAPSVTLWRRWRGSAPPTSEAPALALADPVLAGQSEATAGEASVRQWAFEQDARLVRLPYARKEGEAVVRALGGESRLLVGEEATERFLKQTDLRRYGVIHFAAHAVINDEVPERSAVLLAPGADDEDGWLQAQDIVSLDLEGRVVVLASCSGAGGQVLRGEGPMSLARAFFQAGAPVVVASLWPLPDDASDSLFESFYLRLARGASVAEALAEAQRQARRQGVPARAWAGLVVLGNGDLVPFPGGLPRTWSPWAVGLLALAAIAALLLLARRLRRG